MSGRQSSTMSISIALIVLVTGCSAPPDGRYYPNRTDWARAQAIWSDPWVAAGETTTVSSLAIASAGVNPRVATEEGAVRGSSKTVRNAEITAATQHDWRLIGYLCGARESFTLLFARGRAGEEGNARASVQYGLFNYSDDPTDKRTVWSRRLVAEVPQHLEPAWPDQPTVQPAAGCSTETPAARDRLVPPGAKLPVPGWPTTLSNDTFAQLAGTANTDTFITSLGIGLYSPQLPAEPATAALSLPSGGSDNLPAGATIPGLVSQAVSGGYTLTFAGCGLGRTVAVLRRPLPEREGATLSVRLVEEPATATSTQFTAAAVIGLPEFAGPPTTATPVTAPCWTNADRSAILAQGNPWFGPTSIQRSTGS